MAYLADNFHHLAKHVFDVSLTTARIMLLNDEAPIDAEGQTSKTIPPDDALRYLDWLESRERPPANRGQAPIEADYQTHEAIVQFLDSVSIDHYVVGEEAGRAPWDQVADAPVGTSIFVVDAIDGSKPYENLSFGYGTNLLALHREVDGDVLDGAAVCNSSGFYLSMTTSTFRGPELAGLVPGGGTDVVAGYVHDNELPLPIEWAGRAPSFNDAVAVVGASPGQRRQTARLLAEVPEGDTLTVYNLGGAPASIGLVLGRLGGLICLRPQTIWDCAYLPILAALAMPMYLLETGQPFGRAEVDAWFRRLTRDERYVKPVPPFLVSRTAEYGDALLQRLSAD